MWMKKFLSMNIITFDEVDKGGDVRRLSTKCGSFIRVFLWAVVKIFLEDHDLVTQSFK